MNVLSLLLLALPAVVSTLSVGLASSVAPRTTLLFSANLTIAEPIVIGDTPFGLETIMPIVGGTFSGPSLKGKVITGLVKRMTGAPSVNHAEANFILTTSDGASIAVTERAAIPYTTAMFEAGSGKYAYLNNVTAWTLSTLPQNNVISLNYWQLSAPAS